MQTVHRVSILLCLFLAAFVSQAKAQYYINKVTAASVAAGSPFAPGNVVTINFQLAAASSPATFVNFSFTSADGQHKVDVVCTNPGSAGGTATATVGVDWFIGAYSLTGIIIVDADGHDLDYVAGDGISTSTQNEYPYYQVASGPNLDFSTIAFAINGCLTTAVAPVLTSLVQTSSSNVIAGAPITYSFAMTPGSSPSWTIGITLVAPDDLVIPAKLAGSLTSGTITIPTGTDWLNGTYTVYSITLSDANSSTTYKAGDWGLSGVQLSGGVAAISYPQLTSLTAPGANPIGLGQTVNLNYTISPGTDPVARVTFTYAGPDAYGSTMLLGSSEVITSTSSTSAGATVRSGWLNGAYTLRDFSIVDTQGRTVMYSWVGNSGGWTIFEGPSGTHINVPVFLYNNDSTFGFDVTGALAPPPNITSQPTGGTVQPGQTMALTVAFSGPPVIGLQWYVGQPGDTSNPIAGATGSTLTPPPPSSTTTYWARITNLWSSVDTLGATITVAYTSNLPVILTPPQQIYDLWYDAYDALTVFAVGPGPLAYQWYQNNVAVSGATSSQLEFNPGTPANNGTYTVTISNSNGSVTSTPVTVAFYLQPAITVQPVSQTVAVGGTISFSVSATGGGLNYTWWQMGAPLPSIVGSSATLVLTNVQPNQAGNYKVVIGNPSGSVTSSIVSLTVTGGAAPLISTQPQGQSVVSGSSVTLVAAASGTPLPAYQWQFNGTNIAGATNATLALPSAQASNAGSYDVVVSNSLGQATSSTVVLAVFQPYTSASYTFTTIAGSTQPGSADGTGSAARFNGPGAVAVDGAGNAYVADWQNQTVRKITPGGVVTTLAGTPGVYGSADGIGSAARFCDPSGVAVDSTGNVYVADSSNNTIRKITPGGTVTTMAGLAGAWGSADGSGSAARFDMPYGVAVDGPGNVYVADSQNHTIRKITPGGVVTTLAGSAGVLGSADGTGSAARFCLSWAVAVDVYGNVYVADLGNSLVRKLAPGGVVTTLAGSAGVQGTKDGVGEAALFEAPIGVAVDGAGNVYVADFGGFDIRKIAPNEGVTTIAGMPQVQGSADGTGSAARFNGPSGIGVDGAANLYVADTGNNTIRKGAPNFPTIDAPPSSLSVYAGSTATFSVGALGDGNLSYQWQMNGVAIPGATGATYAIANAQMSSAGSYTVTVSEAAGSINSPAAILTVNTSVAPAFTIQPQSQSAAAGSSVTFAAAATGTPAPTYQWFFNSMSVSGATSASYSVSNVQASNSGSYFVVATNAGGSTMSSGAMLTVNAQSGGPTIGTQPVSQTMAAGSTVAFSVDSSGVVQSVSSASPGAGSGPRADASGTGTTYQWYRNGIEITGATNSMLVIQAYTGMAGAYTCMETNSNGSVLSNAANLTVNATTRNPGRLINLSVNAVAGGASQILTVGFYNNAAGADTSQTLLIQALGPVLSTLGVPEVMPDPQLNVFNGGQSIIGSNAGWGSPKSNQAAVIAADAATYATPLSDPASKDSAVVASLQPGGYTVQVSSVSGIAGTTLAALYDDTPGAFNPMNPRLINISCRLQLGAKGVLTAGFTVGGETSTTVLIRASGPALLAQGVSGVMPDPQLMVFDANQDVITSNAGWGGSSVISSIASSVYAAAFPNPNGADSAVVLTLPPGSFTVQATSVSGAAGDVMIEVFDVP